MPKRKLMTQRYSNFGGVNHKTSEYATDITQFLDLRNMDFDKPNALGKRPGSTQVVTAGTSGRITSMWEYEKFSGFSQVIVGANAALFFLSAGSFNPIITGLDANQPFDFQTFGDLLWATNGQTYIKYNGTSPFGGFLPMPPPLTSGTSGISGISWGGFTTPVQSTYAYAYLDIFGNLGPINAASATPAIPGTSFFAPTTIQLSGFTTPANYGITSLIVYRQDRGTKIGVFPDPDRSPFFMVGTLAAGAATFLDNFGNTSLQSGFTIADNQFAFTMIPKFIENHNNSFFYSGFTPAPSVVRFTPVGQPIASRPEFFFEVRTNDGDKIKGKKSFQGQCLIFKRRSFHKVIGDNPNNYELIELSTEYGLLSNAAVVEYDEGRLAWLDARGICDYDGARWELISDAIEHIFRRMNIEAAVDQACAVHHTERRQIWFGIPIDGSTVNNFTVVYDYRLGAFTFFEGFNPSSMLLIKGPLPKRQVYMGDYSGLVHYFNPSFYGDNGRGISCVGFPRFEAPDGHNVTNLFRRYFMDVTPVAGLTGVINIEVFKNFNETTVIATFPIYQDQFQTREDFGIPAKSIAFKFSHFSASLPFTVPGYGIARRFLRQV